MAYLKNNPVCSGSHRRPVAVYRFLDVPPRVRLRGQVSPRTPPVGAYQAAVPQTDVSGVH